MTSTEQQMTQTKEVSVEEIIPAHIQAQTKIRFFVLKWTEQLVEKLQADYDRQYKSNSNPCRFEINTKGKKYYKIVEKNGGVHAFVNKQTGEVYKPASWKSPAKHVRYNLSIIEDRKRCFDNADWAGSYLYLRG
tara:strand:+ start:163 stop:564 length:402 start_codon:yes stop_codon:yes gene_type:complete